MHTQDSRRVIERSVEIARDSGHKEVHFIDFLMALSESQATHGLLEAVKLDVNATCNEIRNSQLLVGRYSEQINPKLSTGVAAILDDATKLANTGQIGVLTLWEAIVQPQNWRTAKLLNSLKLPIADIHRHLTEANSEK